MDESRPEPKFEVEFFIEKDYDVSAAANKILERFLDHKIDLKTFRRYLEDRIEHLTKFVISKSDYLELLCGTDSLSEKVERKLKDVELKTRRIVKACSELDNKKVPGREVSSKAFGELNELLIERAKIIAEKARLENERKWASLKRNVKECIDVDDLKGVSALVSMAREHLSKINVKESLEEKVRILDEVEAGLCELLENGQRMNKYKDNPEKLIDLLELSTIIGKCFVFFALCVSPLRKDVEEWWKSYTSGNEEAYSPLKDVTSITKHLDNLNTNANRQGSAYIEWLQQFFQKSISRVKIELEHISHLSKGHEVLAVSSILDVFCALTPSFSRRFNILIYSGQEKSVKDIAELYDVCVKFSIGIEKAVIKFLDSEDLTEKLIQSRTFYNYSESLFGCFVEFQSGLADSERAYMEGLLRRLDNDIAERGEKQDPAQKFEFDNLVSDMFDEIHRSISRCVSVTQGLSMYALVPQLDSIMKNLFFKMYDTIFNFKQVDPPFPLPSSAKPPNIASCRYPMPAGKRKPSQNRAQFLCILEILNFCAEFCSRLNRVSERIVKDAVTPPNFPLSKFYKYMHDNDISITATHVLHTQPTLKDNILELRRIRATSTQLRIESLSMNRACSDVSRSLFKSTSESLSSMIELSQKTLIENLCRPIDDSLCELGREPDDSTPASHDQEEGPWALPSRGVAQIGEYLLTLPLFLDPYLSNKALRFSPDTLPLGEDILKECEPLRRPEGDDPNDINDENYTLACWIRAIISLTVVKFGQVLSEMIASGCQETQQLLLNADTTYLDKVAHSLDEGLSNPFSRAIECAKYKTTGAVTQK